MRQAHRLLAAQLHRKIFHDVVKFRVRAAAIEQINYVFAEKLVVRIGHHRLLLVLRFQSSLRDSLFRSADPALKRRAIGIRPYGTQLP